MKKIITASVAVALLTACNNDLKPSNSEISEGPSSEAILTVYIENQLAIDQVWVEMTEASPGTTMAEAVNQWQQLGRPSFRLGCGVETNEGSEAFAGEYAKAVSSIFIEVSDVDVGMRIEFRHSRIFGSGI